MFGFTHPQNANPAEDEALPFTDIWLRTPTIDVGTATSGTLTFQQWTEIEVALGDLDYDPEQAITEARRESGEHGGVAPSIERSSTFTVLEPGETAIVLITVSFDASFRSCETDIQACIAYGAEMSRKRYVEIPLEPAA